MCAACLCRVYRKRIFEVLDIKQKALYSDRIRFSKNNNSTNKTEYNSNSIIDNPFSKVIDRHYGSFKCKLLGNYKNVFNSLNINSIKPLGRYGTVKRKVLRTKKFTAIFYSNGTVELKIARACLSHKTAIESLRDSYHISASNAKAHLEKYYCLALSIPVQNRLAKYGVEDLTAQAVNLEIQGKKRKMDASTRVIAGKVVRKLPHVDNFGAVAAKADARLSEQQHDAISSEIAKRQGLSPKDGLAWRKAKGHARINSPEILESIENAIFETAEASRFLGKNMATHIGIMKEMKEGLHELAFSVRSVRQARHRFPTSFKKSASVKGCR